MIAAALVWLRGINVTTALVWLVVAVGLCAGCYVKGRHDATSAAARQAELAAAKVEAAASKAERAAVLIDMARSTRTQADAAELKEMIDEQATDDRVGDGMQSVLERLRQRSAGAR